MTEAINRREQLLDTAAEIVSERGINGFTMEGLAARAGVSKALPYRHFENAEDVLVELYLRELRGLGTRILEACDGRPDDDLVIAAVGAYFDAIAERGVVLGKLSSSGSHVPVLAVERGAPRASAFLAGMLERAYGVHGRQALVLGNVVAGAVLAAGDSWARGDCSRQTAQEIALKAALGVIHHVLVDDATALVSE